MIGERFRVVKPIGQGAMGAVYIAIDATNEQPVALKILKTSEAAMKAGERFQREIRFLDTLRHPNVVEIVAHGFDEARGLHFYAMELLFGDAISKLTGLGRTSPALGLMVARQAAEGMAFAHEHGIIHRDLKPANLMLIPREDGEVRVKILDFGLAYTAGDDRLTEVGVAPGTVSYMPPEQLLGNDVDQRGDLYCLGVVLFEMLTGMSPFPGKTQIDIATAVLDKVPRRLDEIVPEVPPGLGDLVASLLAKDPADRPATADALVEQVAAFQRSSSLRPITVQHTGPSQNPVRDWSLVDRLSEDLIRPQS